MKFIRVQSSSGVDFFHDRPEGSMFLENLDYTPDTFAARLKIYLEDYPDQTWFLGCFDEDIEEGNIIPVGFLVVTGVEEDEYAFIHQAYMKPDFPNAEEITRMAFHKTVLWADNLGKKGIKMETKREASAWHRSYGFVEHSITMQYDIPEDFELRLFSNKLKESKDGRKQTEHANNGSEVRDTKTSRIPVRKDSPREVEEALQSISGGSGGEVRTSESGNGTVEGGT